MLLTQLGGQGSKRAGTQAAVGVGGGAASTPSYSFPHLVSRVAAARWGLTAELGPLRMNL